MSFNFLENILTIEKENKEAIALVIDGVNYSYGHLLTAAKSMAAFLKKHVKDNIPCIILSNKKAIFYEAMLACFLSNLIYTPINLDGCFNRNIKMLASVKKAIVLIGDIENEQLLPLIPFLENRKIFMMTHHGYPFFEKSTLIFRYNPKKNYFKKRALFSQNDFAYLLFTSGSTGDPKGVPITYHNINAYLKSVLGLFSMRSNDHFSQISDIGFDISIHEILVCWSVGASLYVYNPHRYTNIISFIKDHKITALILIPSMMNQIIKLAEFFKITLDSLKTTFVCGEAFPLVYASSWVKIAPQASIVNFYGPTEATVSCLYHCYDPKNDYSTVNTVPIGQAFPGVHIALTEKMEMVISGDQVFNGYLSTGSQKNKKSRLCIDKKIKHYATGDIAFHHEQHGFVFKERCDDQWQIQGYRIEKSEVENILRSVTGFFDLCVVPSKNTEELIDGLYLFSLENFDLKQYERVLSLNLQPVAIPKKHIVVDFFPRFTNGKINYRALMTEVKK